MTENTVSEIERMVVTRVFDAPRELVWKAWTDPKYIMQWWGPKGFTAPVCQMDFRVGGKFLCCMNAPDGQLEAGMRLNTTRLFPTKRSFPPCTFRTRRETRSSLRN